MVKKYAIIAISVIPIIFGCVNVNVKSKYPNISYYNLTQEATPVSKQLGTRSIDKNIFIKNFTIASEMDTEKIIIIENDTSQIRCNYNQWTAPMDELLMDFVINRANRYEIFKKGIYRSAATANFDMVLECHVISYNIHNYSENSNKQNYVELTFTVNLFSSEKTETGFVPIMSKTYSQKITRADNSINSAVAGLSKLTSEMVDEMIDDIFKMQNY